MSENTNDAGSVDQNQASGEAETVAYASYKKLLTEKKNLQSKMSEMNERLAKFETSQKEAEEKQLLEDKKYQELLANREDELRTTKEELGQWQSLVTDSRKIAAFTDALGAKVESKYHGLIPLNKIEVDSEGNIDGNSLASAVDFFKKEHTRLIVDPKRDLPNHQPGGGVNKISLDEFKELGQQKGSKAMIENVYKAFPELLQNEKG